MVVWCRGHAGSGGVPAEWHADGGGWGDRLRGGVVEEHVGRPGEVQGREARRGQEVRCSSDGRGPVTHAKEAGGEDPSRRVSRVPDFPVLDGGSRSAEPVDQDQGDRVVVVQANNKRRAKR